MLGVFGIRHTSVLFQVQGQLLEGIFHLDQNDVVRLKDHSS